MCVCVCPRSHCLRVLPSLAAVLQVSVAGTRCDLSAVDLQFRTPLHWAAVLGLSEIVNLLLERGADISASDGVGATAQHYAVSPPSPSSSWPAALTLPSPLQAQKNHLDCVTALLVVPGAQDLPDSEGRTPLMWAAQRGNYSVLKAMLEREIDVHACDKLGATGKIESIP